MKALRISAVCLLLVFEVVSQESGYTTIQTTVDHERSTSSDNHLTETVENNLATTEKPEKTNQTDVDTNGDVIITGSPEDETGNNSISNNSSTVIDRNATESTTEISFTTLSETTTLQINWRACSSNPCKNGGLCKEDHSDARFYTCKCSIGYTGTHCQVVDSCFRDEDENICNKGACVYAKDGLSRSCACFFGTFWDEDMKKCKKPEPPCFPNPCHNGTCIHQETGDFQCSCKNGYEGSTCEIRNQCGDQDSCENGECKENQEKKAKYCECHSDFYWSEENGKCVAVEPPCLPNPCKNSGVCETVSSEAFNCTCVNGYSGQTCEIQNFCISETGDHMTCENGACIDSGLSKICSCNEGYFLDPECHTCREIMKPCLPNPCSNDGKCTPLSVDSYNCTCSEGYSGTRCTESDYCALDGGNTFCGDADCKNEPDIKIYYCSCAIGQYFDYASRKCLDVDFCPLMECGENEECRDNRCRCKENYIRDNSSGGCEPDFCSSNPCPMSDLTCTEGSGIHSYECFCDKGYAFDGSHCKVGAVCAFPDLNTCDQICIPEEEGYSCKCEDDFLLGDDNRTCEYIGNSTNCANKTCDNGICVRITEGERCICRPGFEEVEGNCVDLCTSGKFLEGYCPDNKCEATNSGFRCKCEGKYTYSSDDITCKVRKLCDEAEVGWKTCSKRHALCKEDWTTADGFTCKCIEGQVATEGGFCRDICSIEENQRQCSILGAECDVDWNGGKTCQCPPYFLPFENGTACSKPASYSYTLTLPLHPSSYIENERRKRSSDFKFADVDYRSVERDVRKAIEKLFPQLLYSNVLNCRENKDYIKCKIELQFVSITDEDLKKLHLPEICHASKDRSSACLIPPSLIIQKEYLKAVMSIQRTNPCETDIKENLCGSETFCTSNSDESTFKCRCETGFMVRSILYPFGNSESFIENCKDIDECATENPCQDNMECHNTLGSYTCSCRPGYRTKDASKPETSGCLEICFPNPCVHGNCMKISDHTFECKCSPGYNGMLCDLQDESFKRARTNTIIVGAVLGGGLLVVIILSIASISRLKKKKEMLENSEHMLYGTEMTERRGGDAGAINNAYQRD